MEGKNLEKTVVSTLEKLEELELEGKLYSELSWCWNSYKHDKNPIGVIEKSSEALKLLKSKRYENNKSVPKKLIEDLEKIVAD